MIERSRFGPNFSSRTRFLPTSASSVFQPVMNPSCWRISAMCDLILLCGITTESWYAEFALRRRVSMSAMGSVMVMNWPSASLAGVSCMRHPSPRSVAGRVRCGDLRRSKRFVSGLRPRAVGRQRPNPASLRHTEEGFCRPDAYREPRIIPGKGITRSSWSRPAARRGGPSHEGTHGTGRTCGRRSGATSQRWQRVYPRTPNFGLRAALAIRDFFATVSSP